MIERISRNLRDRGVSESQILSFARRFDGRLGTDEVWQDWVECVDASDYGWQEWVDSIILLDKRIEGSSGPSAPVLERLLGYVSCAAEGAQRGKFVDPLPEIVAAALEQYGFADED
ncbi:hypothetical protein [Puniceicoccus vermicola]|uniref:Uncharacterized protein n=1 Tax=Puniceicoccus vermicola TaxID=388746 RepID=A0A7X1AV55_9BACT|nr:hypothetical protein [Puniceicoccus vermicola]MBC2600593.1 hypothetical protein [Puniceicoccus vermicola]